MDALGHSAVPQLQLRPGQLTHTPVAPAIPGILGGGSFPNRWIPDAVRLKPDTTDAERQSGTSEAVMASRFSRTNEIEPPSAVASGFSRTNVADIKPMIPLGQFRDTFIIAVDDDGLAIIDQHVAHERVLFERVMEKLTAGRLESQRLLVPMTLDLTPSAHDVLMHRASELERLGFDIESFGASTIKVNAVPALLKTEDSSKALVALAEDLEGLDRGAHVQDALQRIAATTACHAAVKANYPLTYEKMMHILEELRATAYSSVCPHGRPVMLRLTRREIEKNFDRI
jgi:DNA mismatch repair protein MutL